LVKRFLRDDRRHRCYGEMSIQLRPPSASATVTSLSRFRPAGNRTNNQDATAPAPATRCVQTQSNATDDQR
jgi:hypothetical protein